MTALTLCEQSDMNRYTNLQQGKAQESSIQHKELQATKSVESWRNQSFLRKSSIIGNVMSKRSALKA